MNGVTGLRVVVAGAGAVGSVAALHMAKAGAHVVLADPGRPNASTVAAGMLAPVCETLFDPLSAGHFVLFRRAREAWAALAGTTPSLPPIDQSGALIRPDDDDALRQLLARAAGLGADLQQRGRDLFTPEDWRLDAGPMLAGLHAALESAGGRRLAAAAKGLHDGAVRFDAAAPIPADVLIMATGNPSAALTPIKGQLLRFPGFGARTGPVLRAQGVYAAPGSEGLVVGATMEEGISDSAIDPRAVEALRAAAVRLYPDLADAPFAAAAGVRWSTADGLPLVGPGDAPGLYVAGGARRNGWLLAPLMAKVLAERIAGPPLSVAARAFDPARFPRV